MSGVLATGIRAVFSSGVVVVGGGLMVVFGGVVHASCRFVSE
jgi:hypothetical protein